MLFVSKLLHIKLDSLIVSLNKTNILRLKNISESVCKCPMSYRLEKNQMLIYNVKCCDFFLPLLKCAKHLRDSHCSIAMFLNASFFVTKKQHSRQLWLSGTHPYTQQVGFSTWMAQGAGTRGRSQLILTHEKKGPSLPLQKFQEATGNRIISVFILSKSF